MPTGYTAAVADGKITELKDFALQCARGMGALVMMRDEPWDAPSLIMPQIENPPAFPLHAATNPDLSVYAGMTLRDWFAGQALSGWLADPNVGGDPSVTAMRAYTYADAMLAERAKQS